MNRLLINPISSMSDCPVQWRELIPIFQQVFPRTIQDCMDNEKRARVSFHGMPFDIIPENVTGFEPRFSVWGPPHIIFSAAGSNQSPDAP
jgi:hypothetical protein